MVQKVVWFFDFLAKIKKPVIYFPALAAGAVNAEKG
jgi:hypothetical protein